MLDITACVRYIGQKQVLASLMVEQIDGKNVTWSILSRASNILTRTTEPLDYGSVCYHYLRRANTTDHPNSDWSWIEDVPLV